MALWHEYIECTPCVEYRGNLKEKYQLTHLNNRSIHSARGKNCQNVYVVCIDQPSTKKNFRVITRVEKGCTDCTVLYSIPYPVSG